MFAELLPRRGRAGAAVRGAHRPAVRQHDRAIASTLLGIPTVDVGNPMLSMHSAREMGAAAIQS